MPHYVLAFRGGSAPETAEQAVLLQRAWADWLAGLGPALMDPGGPFGAASSVTDDGSTTDRVASDLSGYTIVMAADLREASSLAATSPILVGDGEVDVYEVLPMSGD